MLAAITSRPGEVVRRRAVVAAAWPNGGMVSENTVDSYIRRIRVKLREVGSPLHAHHRSRGRLHTEVMRAPSRAEPLDGSARGPSAATIVASTVALMTVSMIVVGLVIQLLLGAGPPTTTSTRCCTRRADAAMTVIEQASTTSLTVPPDSLEPGIVVYDADGEPARGLGRRRRPRRRRRPGRAPTRSGPRAARATRRGCWRCRSPPRAARAACWS